MPVSVFVKALCKVMKTLVEDEVVVNDVMLQLSTEMALTHKEVPRVLFLKGKEEDTCIVPNEIAWIGAEGSFLGKKMTSIRGNLVNKYKISPLLLYYNRNLQLEKENKLLSLSRNLKF